MKRLRPARRNAAAAFSLIEILISVLILALGLLGLGALFPVVLREQRIGTDNINGVIAANNVKAMLAQMNLNMLMPTGGPPNRDVWASWRWRQSDGTAELSRNNQYELGQWDVCTVNANGGAIFGDRRTSAAQVEVPLAARLFPMAGADRGRPQFVWDIAVHRYPDFVPNNSSQRDPLQAVIFVRRIDPRIRVPSGNTLTQVLLGDGVAANERRLPVGKQAGSNIFLPTLDGTDGADGLEYSVPIVAERGVDFNFVQDEGRYITGINTRQNDGKGALMAQPNQKLVDNLGNVYTVEAVEQDPQNANRVRLRIAPPIAGSLTGPQQDDLPHVNQFVFTAQVPAGVVVTEVLR